MRLLGHDWEFYAALYLGAGVILLLVVLAAKWRWLRLDPQSLTSLIEAANPETRALWCSMRAKALAPVLGGTLMVLLCPVAPLTKLGQWWENWRAEQRRKNDVFWI
jgi:hypothetical protein